MSREQNKRLLTDEEIGKAYKRGFERNVKASNLTEEIKKKRFEGATSVAEAQDAKTLREVGEWLEKKESIVKYAGFHEIILDKPDLQALKQGKLGGES